MDMVLQYIQEELSVIHREGLAGRGCKGQDYWRGYRDALRAVRGEILDRAKEERGA